MIYLNEEFAGEQYSAKWGHQMKIINENIKDGRFKRVYLICGEEDYLRRQYKDKLREAITGKDDMNYSYFEGKQINVKEVIDVCETLPFFADMRLVVLENTGFFKNACDDALLEYVKNIPEYLTILFVENETDKRSRLYKAVSQNGYICEMKIQEDGVLKKWIASLLTAQQKKMDGRTLDMFLEYAGNSMDNIRMELEKLICYAIEREVITAEDVRQVCTVTTVNKIFDMVSAVALKRQQEALELYYDLLTLKEPPMRILYLLSRQFNLILQVKELSSEGYQAASIAKKMGVQNFIVNKCLNQAGHFTMQKLREALEECASYEEAVKTGRLEDKMCVELIIIKYSQRKEE